MAEVTKAKVTKVAKKAEPKAAKSNGNGGKKAEAKAAAPAKGEAKQGRRTPIVEEFQGKKLKLLVEGNPKRGDSAKRFDLYKNGDTIEKLMEKGVKTADLRWDLNKQFIKFE